MVYKVKKTTRVKRKKTIIISTTETIDASINLYIAIRLRDIRKSKGLTQQQVALTMGCNYTQIVRMEKGVCQSRFESLIKILKALDSTFMDILPKELLYPSNQLDTDLSYRSQLKIK